MYRPAISMILSVIVAISYGCAARPTEVKTVPAGTASNVELLDTVSSASSSPGSTLTARVNEDVVVDGKVVIPSGSTVTGTVAEARGLKAIGGKARLHLEFNSVSLPSGETAIHAAYIREGKSETKKDAATIGGAAAGGALLGRLFSRNHEAKGTGAGAVIGGAAGTAIAAGTKGEEVTLPTGTRLALHLTAPVSVRVEV